MTPETYIPITPSTRIPFPCWLWDTEFGWIDRKQPVSSANLLSLRITHYCTSATEPVGRPGEKDDDKVFRKKFVATLEGSTEDASTTVPTGRPEELQGPTEDGYANYHDSLSSPAVPTASGATGEALDAAREILAVLHSRGHVLRHHSYGTAPVMTEEEMSQIIARHIPASRPAVAQEGVRDTERLDWLEANSAGLNDAYSPPGPHVWVNLLGELKHFHGKSYRAAIDAAMSSQPEGRG